MAANPRQTALPSWPIRQKSGSTACPAPFTSTLHPSMMRRLSLQPTGGLGCAAIKKKKFFFNGLFFLQIKCRKFHLIFAFISQVWVGSVTEITVVELSAEDADTPDEGIEFVVTPPSNGHLALKSAPSRHILNFTQHHIESRQLLFVHSGQLFYFVDFSSFILQHEKTRTRDSFSFPDVCVQELCQVVFTSR